MSVLGTTLVCDYTINARLQSPLQTQSSRSFASHRASSWLPSRLFQMVNKDLGASQRDSHHTIQLSGELILVLIRSFQLHFTLC